MKLKKILNKLSRIMHGNLRLAKMDGLKIGENCSISKSVVFGTEPYLIQIVDNVRITQGVNFVTHDGSLHVIRNLDSKFKNIDKFGKIIIGDNVNIGWNSTIMPGVTIGNNVIIGLGSIVTKDIPDNVVVAGVPAKIISNIEEYISKNQSQFVETKNLSKDEKKKILVKEYFK